MHALRLFWGPVAGLIGLTLPLPAYACGSVGPSYFSFGAPTPADSSVGVPRDAPIAVALNAYAIDGSPISPSSLSLESATLSDSAGSEVRLDWSVWSSDESSLVITPLTALLANERYHLRVRIAESNEPTPAGAVENDTLALDFTTGSEFTPALALTGELEISLRTEQVPTMICDALCGGPCRESGQHSALMAHVSVPALSGGTGALLGYHGALYLTPGEPVAVGSEPFTGSVSGVRASLQLAPSAPQTIDLELYDEAKANRACFTFQAWDPGARHVVSLAKCIDSPTTQQAPTAVDDGSSDSSPESRACSVAAAVGRGASGWPSLFLATLLGSLGVRRWARSCRRFGGALRGANDAVDTAPCVDPLE